MVPDWILQVSQCKHCKLEEDEQFETRTKPGQTFAHVEEILARPACRPKPAGVPTYSTALDQALLGIPIREGRLYFLTTQDRFEPITFHLYVNGVAFMREMGEEASMTVSPFSLVRNCRFQSGECAQLKSFKISLLEHEQACYFAVQTLEDREAEEERAEWVLGISNAILLVTESLLPQRRLVCDPLRGAPNTKYRLLAGFLIRRIDMWNICVVFAELQAQSGEEAKLRLYEDETCSNVVAGDPVIITECSMCCDAVGINCSCFLIDGHHFAARSPSERKLWLRALSNLKVKLQNQEPAPSDEELYHFRNAIREQIWQLDAISEARIAPNPLLRKSSPILAHGCFPHEYASDDEVVTKVSGGTETSPNADRYYSGGKKRVYGEPFTL